MDWRNVVLRLSTAMVFFALQSASGIALAQAPFSADIVNRANPHPPFKTRLYATRDKLRFEGQGKDGRTVSIMISNLATRHSIVLMPQQHMYVEQSRVQIPGQGVTFFQARDVNDACEEWQQMAPNRKCSKVGPETVNGRETVKYKGTSAKGETTFIWLDTKLHFPVKWQGPVGSGGLRNIQEGEQPAALFEVPAGYVKRGSAKAPSQPPDSKSKP